MSLKCGTRKPVAMKIQVAPASDSSPNMQNGSGVEKINMSDLSQNAPVPEVSVKKYGPPSWKESWVEFTQTTSIHGLRFIWMDHAFVFRKMLWLILVTSCAAVMGYQIIDRIIYFSRHPVTVNVNVNFNKTLTFPSVTICNQNNFRATRATELGQYRLLEAMYTKSGYLNTSLLSKYGASNLTLDQLQLDTAHSKYDFIVDCEWQNAKCGPENFTESLTDHGLCFTFNSLEGEERLLVASTGSEYGLKLTLNVEQYEYMPGPHDAAGLKMLLHDGKEYPSVAELGLAIPTGTHAYVGIQLVQIDNLPKPHGNCGSLTSPYYQDYSTDNCQLACLTEYVSEACGCRHHYMPSVNGQPPICTLEQYYGCYLPNIGILKDRMRDECECPIPCYFVIFDPAISFATTSAFAADRLLAAASRTSDLKTKYLTALETTHRMEQYRFDRFVDKMEEVRHSFEDLTFLMLDKVKATINVADVTFQDIVSDMKSAWDRKQYLYEWQEYQVTKNFIRPRDAMAERTFTFLAMGFQEFATRIEAMTWTLVDPNVTSSEARSAIYSILMATLNAKIDLADRAFANFTELYTAYYNGTPIFRYQFGTEDRDDNVYITPKPLLNHAVAYDAYTAQYSERMGEDILNFKGRVQTFADLATKAFDTGNLTEEEMYTADVMFLWTGRRFMNSKSIFDTETIEYPLRIMQERIAAFQLLWRDYTAVVQESEDNIQSLKGSWQHLENSILHGLNQSLQHAEHYVHHADNNVTKLGIAQELTSHNIYAGISEMKVFFQSLRSRGQKMYDNWENLIEITNKIWKVIIDDEDMIEYYLYKNMTDFLRRVDDVQAEVTQQFYDYRQRFDFRYLIGSADSLFLKSLEEFMADMEEFIQNSHIGTDFIKENFLQLDVFYREKSYEQITQQIAYDGFALLCDIGGSMGLFVGASVLSIGELIDLLLHQSVYRLTHSPR